MAATREAFAAHRQRRYLLKEISGFDAVRIQSLTAGELHSITSAPTQQANGLLFVKTVVDDAGRRLFADEEWQEFNLLDAAVGGQLIEAISNHISSMEIDPKNSPATSGDDSRSN